MRGDLPIILALSAVAVAGAAISIGSWALVRRSPPATRNEVEEQVPDERPARSVVALVLLGAALLCFLLPFAAVDCGGGLAACGAASGLEVIQGGGDLAEPAGIAAGDRGTLRVLGGLSLALAVAAPAAAMVRSRRARVVGGALAVGGALMLLATRSAILRSARRDPDIGVALWLAAALLAAAAAWLFVEAARGRAPTESGGPPTGGRRRDPGGAPT